MLSVALVNQAKKSECGTALFWAWIIKEHSTIVPNNGRCYIVNKTSPEANWSRRTAQDHILSQADTLTKNSVLE